MNCNKCWWQQFSEFDKKYLQVNWQCWSCDKLDWEEWKISLEEFENREVKADF